MWASGGLLPLGAGLLPCLAASGADGVKGGGRENPFEGWSRPEKLGRVAPFPELLVSKLGTGDPRQRRGGARLAALLWEKVLLPRGAIFQKLWKSRVQLLFPTLLQRVA